MVGVSESSDEQGSAILALESALQNLIFAWKSLQKIYFTRFYACHFSKENWKEPPVLYFMNDLQAIFLIFIQKGKKKFSDLLV